MSFTGKYQQVSQDNIEPFMKAIGIPDEVIQQVKAIKSISEIEQNGNDFKITTTTGPKVMVNKFTIGKETEMETITGEKIKTVFHLDGKKLKVSLQGIESVTELVDPNTIVNVSGPAAAERLPLTFSNNAYIEVILFPWQPRRQLIKATQLQVKDFMTGIKSFEWLR